MADDVGAIIEKLDILTRLVAIGLVQGKSQRDQIELLSKANLQPREIADLIGIRRFKENYRTLIAYQGKRITGLIKRGKGARLVKPDHERAIPIIEGILTDDNHKELSVNLPNNGVITNLPRDLVVECPATINKDCIHAIKL